LLPALVFAFSQTETISVPAGTTRTLTFQLSWGDIVKGTISVSGGILHQGVNIIVVGPQGESVLNMGTVTDNAPFEFTGGFIRGGYELRIENPSWLTSKTVTVNYDIETNFWTHYNYEIIEVAIAIVVIVVSILLYKWVRRRSRERYRVCPSCGKRVAIQKSVCPHCGFDIAKSVRCQYCSASYDRFLEKCPNCGAKNEQR
jgi:predicted RNA-binding Zn-ribbon protein involved in translation (DUF1610 family)